MPHRSLSQFVAAALIERAPALASHWRERAQAATPRHPLPPARAARPGADGAGADAAADGAPDRSHAERVLRALADEVTASTAAAALLAGDAAAVAAGVAAPAADPLDARPSADVMQLGWMAGAGAFEAGLSVHHVVRDADLLLAIVLADLERSVDALAADEAAALAATPGAAFGAARRLQRAMGRYTQAAASGFVHALLRNLRERYRLLRHDLRNPLGTIRSALSLMDDETVPEEMRHGPGIRSMVARNAGSLDQLISSGLDDAAAAALLIPPQDVALRDVALAARREVREAARLAECAVVIGDMPADPPSHVDPAALELTLTALLLAGLAHAGPGDAVRVDCINRGDATGRAASESPDGRPRAVVRVTVSRDRADEPPDTPDSGDALWDEHGLALAASLAADHGGALSADPAVADATDLDQADLATLARADALYLHLPVADEITAA